jgi:hypothetical protein
MNENSPMNADRSDDELLRALAEANPSPAEANPSPAAAASPQAQALLDQILSSSPSLDNSDSNPPSRQKGHVMPSPTPDQQPADEPVRRPADEPVQRPADKPSLRPAAAAAPLAAVDGEAEVPMIDTYASGPSRRNRSRGLMIGAAAAVVLLALAALTLVPINTTSAVAEVQSAAAATDAARSGRIDTVFSLDGSGTHSDGDGTETVEDVSVDGTVTMLYRGDDLQLSVELDELPFEGLDGADGGPDLAAATNDIRLVDGIVYVKPYGEWLAIDTNGLVDSMITDQVNPREVLTTIQELTEATEIGAATLDGPLDGLAVTHYQSVVDLGDETLSSSGWVPFEAGTIESDGEVTIDTYVDDDGLLRRLVVSGAIEEATDTDSGSATFEIETNFTDLGDNVIIEAPEGAVEFGTGFLGQLDEEVDA